MFSSVESCLTKRANNRLVASSIMAIRYSFSPRPSNQSCSLVSHCTSSPNRLRRGRQTCTCWIFSFFARHSLPRIIHVRTVSLLASIPCLLPRYSAAKVGPNPSYTGPDKIFTACFSIFSSIRRFDGFPRSPWTTALSPRFFRAYSSRFTCRVLKPSSSAASRCVISFFLAFFNVTSRSRSAWVISSCPSCIPQAWGCQQDISTLLKGDIITLLPQFQDGLEGHYRRIVDYDVDLLPLIESGFDRSLYLARITDITLQKDRVASACGNLRHGLIAVLLVEIDHRYQAAFGREFQSNGLSDTGARASNEADFAGETHGYAGNSVAFGNPCCSRPTSPSYFLVVLNNSHRPSAASDRQRSRRLCIAAELRGWKPRAMSRFCFSTPGDSMPLIITETGRLMAYESASAAVTAPCRTISPLPPMLFMPNAAMLRRFNSGSTFCSKLRKVASKQFKGNCTVSNGKPWESIFR